MGKPHNVCEPLGKLLLMEKIISKLNSPHIEEPKLAV
jgi:hypothetical protein